MPGFFSVWVSLIVLSLPLRCTGAFVCSEKETLINPIQRTVTRLSDCLMECTVMMYVKKLQLQDNHNIRLTDSTEGDLGEHCWSTDLKCTVGETFKHAYVVLPVDMSEVRHDMLEVKATGPTAAPLQAHNSPTTVVETCGLRYDVTQHFSSATAGTSFCVQVATLEDVLGDKALKCPPYLVTFWQRSPDLSSQGGVR